MQRFLEIALARLLRFQPREITENVLPPARNERFPILRRSRILLQRRLEPRRHAMLRAVPVPRIEADLHPNAITDLRSGRLAARRRASTNKNSRHRPASLLIRHGTEGLPLIRTRTGSGLVPTGLEGFCLGAATRTYGLGERIFISDVKRRAAIDRTNLEGPQIGQDGHW